MSAAPPALRPALAAVGLLLAACSPALTPPGTAGERGADQLAAAPQPQLGGWMLAAEDVNVRDAQVTPDGRRLFILRGTRWVDHPDGSVTCARQVFEQEDVKGLALPEHLGGGYVFYATTGPSTDLWRAASWTGELTPLGRVEPPVSQIIPGFDRLYLTSATSHALRAIDLESGQSLELAPLPRASAYGEMAFLDAWTGVVLAGVRGALASFDAGESWTPIGAPEAITGVALGPPGKLLVSTDSQRYELDASGHLVATSPGGSDALFEGAQPLGRYEEDAFPRRPAAQGAASPLGRRPLRAAVLRGIPDTPETAVVLEAGALGRVRLRDGALLSSQPYHGSSPCRGVPLGHGIGFVCGAAGGPTEIHAHAEQRLQPLLRLDGAHRVRSSGNGALIIEAPCALVRSPLEQREAPRARPPAPGQHCVRTPAGELFDLVLQGELGSERVVALRDGRAVVVVPPRPGNPGRLSIVDASGQRSERELSLEPESGPAARLARSGLWLDELWETEPGQLGAWIVGAQAFTGARIDLDGLVQLGRVQDGVEETSFYGPHALQIAASASLRESDDFGFDWHISEVPPVLVSTGLARSAQRPARGCSPVGCVHDDWLRVGYGEPEEGHEPGRPEAPEKVAFPSSGFAFWNLECRATGGFASGNPLGPARKPPAKGSEAAPRSSARSRSSVASPAEPPESSAWIQFQGLAPPGRGPSDLGYDIGETNENGAYRAYAWGPGRGDWARHGRWTVRVGDSFSLAAPWTTLPSRVPWVDAASAGQAFGLDNNLGVDWWLRLGATGESGLLQIRVRSESSLHLIARERGITTLQAPPSTELGTLAGVQEVNDRWYVGSSRAEQFQLYRVEQGRLQQLATYPLWGRIPTQLIRSVQGDELGLLQKSTGAGWLVLPIDLETYQPKPGFHISNEQLGKVPPACEEGRPGWLAASGVPLTDSSVSESNTHLEFAGSATGLRTKRLTARLVMDESGVCVDALAALVDGAAGTDLRSPDPGGARRGLPLVVTDPADDRRWAFVCTH